MVQVGRHRLRSKDKGGLASSCVERLSDSCSNEVSSCSCCKGCSGEVCYSAQEQTSVYQHRDEHGYGTVRPSREVKKVENID